MRLSVSRDGATGECGQEAGTGAKAGLDGVKVNESKAGESGASGETHEQVSWEEGSAVRPGTKGVWSWYGESPDADANPQLYTDSDLYVKNEAETSTAAQRGASTSTNTNERPRMKQSEATPLECLTRGGMTKLLEVQERYEGDKAAILTVLVRTPSPCPCALRRERNRTRSVADHLCRAASTKVSDPWSWAPARLGSGRRELGGSRSTGQWGSRSGSEQECVMHGCAGACIIYYKRTESALFLRGKLIRLVACRRALQIARHRGRAVRA